MFIQSFVLSKHNLCIFVIPDTARVATPTLVYLWRRREPSGLSGISLLWDIPQVWSKGIKEFTCERLLDDILHTKDLGVVQRYLGFTLLSALNDDVFNVGAATRKDRHERGIPFLRRRLRAYYRTQRLVNREHKKSRIRHLTLSMLGTLRKPVLSAKGGQSKQLVGFAVNLMHSFSARGGQKYHLLAAAGRACGL